MTPDTLAELTAIRHDLHQIPELSGQEDITSKRVADLLSACQPDQLLTGLGGYGLAAVFDSGKPGPTVAIRCELDGLPITELGTPSYVSRHPGKGHLCGHDGHMVMVLGVARTLAEARPRMGRVVLFYQPAEETGQGAIAYRADPRFSSIAPDYIFALHNLPGVALGQVELCQSAANCASRGMRITLSGKTSHAAAPEDGVSPAAALASLIPKLDDLGQGGELTDGFALTTITHAKLGEPTFGVAPGHAELWVTLRTVSDTRMAQLVADAQNLVAQATTGGLTCEIAFDDIFEACTNDALAGQMIQAACAEQGVDCMMTTAPQKFSEDFGQFGKSAKSAMFWLGSGQDHPQLHNPDYDFPDALIPIGTGVFLSAIRQVLG